MRDIGSTFIFRIFDLTEINPRLLTARLGVLFFLNRRMAFPLSVSMIKGSGYSVTTTNGGCFPLGSVAPNEYGRALARQVSSVMDIVRVPDLNLFDFLPRSDQFRWILPIESKERRARWP